MANGQKIDAFRGSGKGSKRRDVLVSADLLEKLITIHEALLEVVQLFKRLQMDLAYMNAEAIEEALLTIESMLRDHQSSEDIGKILTDISLKWSYCDRQKIVAIEAVFDEIVACYLAQPCSGLGDHRGDLALLDRGHLFRLSLDEQSIFLVESGRANRIISRYERVDTKRLSCRSGIKKRGVFPK